MPRTVLWGLKNSTDSKRFQNRGYLFGLVAHDGNNRSGLQGFACCDNMLHQSASASAVKHFGERRFQASAFSRRQYHNREI
jgi:hypothetical protein